MFIKALAGGINSALDLGLGGRILARILSRSCARAKI